MSLEILAINEVLVVVLGKTHLKCCGSLLETWGKQTLKREITRGLVVGFIKGTWYKPLVFGLFHSMLNPRAATWQTEAADSMICHYVSPGFVVSFPDCHKWFMISCGFVSASCAREHVHFGHCTKPFGFFFYNWQLAWFVMSVPEMKKKCEMSSKNEIEQNGLDVLLQPFRILCMSTCSIQWLNQIWNPRSH